LPPADRDPQRLAEALKVLEGPFKVLDGALAGRSYLLGEDFTVADLNVAAVISRAIDMDMPATPRVGDWLERCLDRPAAHAARAWRARAAAKTSVEGPGATARQNRWGAPPPLLAARARDCHAQAQRRHFDVPTTRRRGRGPAHASGRPVLGQEGFGRLVDPERGIFRRRGRAGGGQARIRRGDGGASAGLFPGAG